MGCQLDSAIVPVQTKLTILRLQIPMQDSDSSKRDPRFHLASDKNIAAYFGGVDTIMTTI